MIWVMVAVFMGGAALATVGWIFAAHYANPRGKAEDAMAARAEQRNEEHLRLSREMYYLMGENSESWKRIAIALEKLVGRDA